MHGSRYVSLTALGFAIVLLGGLNCGGDGGSDPEIKSYSVSSRDDLAALSGITVVTGDLRIEGSVDLTDLSGLESLTAVDGHLSISFNDSLLSLDGLDNLTSVGRWFTIEEDHMLESIQALGSLTSVGAMVLVDCDSLPSLEGLNQLRTITDDLTIRSLARLTDIDALAGLDEVGGLICIAANDNLSNLDGLDGLTALPGGLSIGGRDVGNPLLVSLWGLRNVKSIGRKLEYTSYVPGLYIAYNSSLVRLTGLEAVESVGCVDIRYNYALTDVDGLAGLEMVDTYLTIRNNLALLDLAGLENLVTVGGDLELHFNISLQSLGLDALDRVGGNFSITNNSKLPTDLAIALRNQVLAGSGIGGDVSIIGNLGG